jgi:hypothetical protein
MMAVSFLAEPAIVSLTDLTVVDAQKFYRIVGS